MAMNRQTTTQALMANKWYPIPNGNKKAPYPSPQSILRGSVGESDYKFEAKTVNTEHIRAACIMPRGIPYIHLLQTPWSMAYTTKEWVMIIVSVLDFYSWVDLARASGAIGWQVGHAKTHTFQWEPPRLDQHKLEIRPPNTLKLLMPGPKTTWDSQIKEYDKEAVLDLLREGNLTHTEIGKIHGISRITVQRISARAGLSSRKPHWGGVNVS
jgi:hypothetical protein